MKFSTRANIIAGENTYTQLPSFLKEYGINNPAILVDKNLFVSSDYIVTVIKNIVSDDKLVFYDYSFEPSYQLLDSLMQVLNDSQISQKIDAWIGIGGGSTMDTAKGLAILCNNYGPSINYMGFPTELNKPLPVIAIPSTTGTGSEVVYNASFIEKESKVKMGINYKENYPVLAILDPLIPSTAPLKVLASSGCDALVHALESFMSNESNDQVRLFSKRAYRLIMHNMVPLLKGEGNLNNWLNMQWAAVYAMFALSNSTSGPASALSYYLGTHYKVNHGIAGGAFIGKVVKYNHKNGYLDLSLLYSDVDQLDLNDEEKSYKVISDIDELLQLAKIPEKLDNFGVQHLDHPGFNEFAKQSKSVFAYNPIPIDLNRVSEYFVK